jgi:DNA-binding LytR/AlgR family response regulator
MKRFNHKKHAPAPILYITTLCAERGLYGPYTVMVRADGTHVCYSNKTIAHWESELQFIRTDQSHLVNPRFIRRLEKNPNRTGNLWIKGSNGAIPVSRRFLGKVQESMRRQEVN